MRQKENPGALVQESRGKTGSVGTGRMEFTGGSCVEGILGVELYCHGAKSIKDLERITEQ